ncbi:hypothetical protein Pmar_PMAR002223 [Perkinsus marinus ATCC 50983]|uniref:Uncharacterized protein n=1 Tax=Perkinsus marinus (strain ATCC 50983 / TXsc) TaxID=423536 RepID=C5L8Z6_PERM5|nr:hypothetical protein Pmar_PMAR002223 [Perkinsus marinus ATCC 50983]EER06854.1 hypothetical protein Pmar_PMAR002223 [Perkinsus marinus ATCC 50983]|eukprot:XP_002775038.1 hypothetical protein Pmar_PMAR002223 [Perkinsus marinus ATCC 50983]
MLIHREEEGADLQVMCRDVGRSGASECFSYHGYETPVKLQLLLQRGESAE